MTNEADADATLSVAADGVAVEKSFAADEFPVPAVRFHLVSRADEPTHVRLVDEIPESFPMESVGFHPDFESDNWTAYKDHRVEFSRTLDPGEELVTVYGVRLDEGDDPAAFLTDPSLTERPLPDAESLESEDIDDVIGSDDNVVREVLSGERDSLPGLDGPDSSGAADLDPDSGTESADPSPAGAAAVEAVPVPDEHEGEGESGDESGAAAPEPRVIRDDLRPAVTRRDPTPESGACVPEPRAIRDGLRAAVTRRDLTPGSDAEADSADAEPVTPEAGTVGTTDDQTDADATVARGPESVAAALAEEVRAGEADAADLDRLREALLPGGTEVTSAGEATATTNSQDVRIGRLQSKVEDLGAYADAMEEFIDDNGTGSQLIDEMNQDLDEVRSELDALHGRMSSVEDAHDGVRDRVTSLEDDVDAAAGRAETAAERAEAANDRAASNADRVDGVTAEVADATERIDSLDGELGDVREDVASLDADVVDLRDHADDRADGLERDVSRVRGDVADLRDTVEELESFRDRLNSAFGGVGEQSE